MHAISQHSLCGFGFEIVICMTHLYALWQVSDLLVVLEEPHAFEPTARESRLEASLSFAWKLESAWKLEGLIRWTFVKGLIRWTFVQETLRPPEGEGDLGTNTKSAMPAMSASPSDGLSLGACMLGWNWRLTFPGTGRFMILSTGLQGLHSSLSPSKYSMTWRSSCCH